MSQPSDDDSLESLARTVRYALEAAAEFEDDLREALALGEIDEEQYRALKEEMALANEDLAELAEGIDDDE